MNEVKAGVKNEMEQSQEMTLEYNNKINDEARLAYEKAFEEMQIGCEETFAKIDASRTLSQEDYAFQVNARD